MVGTTIEFKTRVETSRDALNDPVYSIVGIQVQNCLIAPITEPTSAREQQALDQMREQVRIHLPKTYADDIGGSYFAWDGKIFQVDSSSVKFMDENTPTEWNRYFRGESVAQFDTENPNDTWLRFFVTEDSDYIMVTEGS